MSRSKKGSKGPGYEYWGKRPAKGCITPSKDNKVITHRLERRQNSKIVRKELNES